MILHHENINFKRHCEFVFGEYVLVHHKPDKTNTNQPHALDCIYLRPTLGNSGHELLHLQKNAVVIHKRCTAMPLTPAVIKQDRQHPI
eukprot:12991645-Ditylum_brightwellii.AAC.1